MNRKPGEFSSPKSEFFPPIKGGLNGPRDQRSDTLCQYARNACLALSRPPAAKPSASTTALAAPGACSRDTLDIEGLFFKQAIEHTPAKAPWLPPPWSARLIPLRVHEKLMYLHSSCGAQFQGQGTFTKVPKTWVDLDQQPRAPKLFEPLGQVRVHLCALRRWDIRCAGSRKLH